MYDLAIIGAGAAGIESAKAALAGGLKVLLVEQSQASFGGTCLNQGCIPAKFFLNSVKSNQTWDKIFPRQSEIITSIKEPLVKSLQAGGLDIVWGKAKFFSPKVLDVEGIKYEAANVIVASGSLPREVLKHPKAIFAQDLFSRKEIPESFLIIGAGYIGIEFASLLKGLNKKVHVIEKEEAILPSFDSLLVKRLRAILNRQGITIETCKDFSQCGMDGFDMAVIAAGRCPNTTSLGLEEAGIEVDSRGWVKTNSSLETNVAGVYACGDVTGKKMLAYTAQRQAGICVNNILGLKKKEDYKGVPECVFSVPSMAQVGVLPQDAAKLNIKHQIFKSNFLKFSSAYVQEDKDGFIEIVADTKGKIIGAGIISKAAAELISLLSLCVLNEIDVKKLRSSLFIHPTLSEIIPQVLL
ncbi:MAG: NAD(P)/FAD-dependent oxidoreductase [Candidatus Omnitrophica bacterium]|nr:NAD(P)/FAD-dependent oxidoreductase [Candidatus Omnitrophota bacterium]MDD5429127.1 NAD(P)/FAD-dependent oxidoreductase [Candidatus Omnitrophota bacterium]